MNTIEAVKEALGFTLKSLGHLNTQSGRLLKVLTDIKTGTATKAEFETEKDSIVSSINELAAQTEVLTAAYKNIVKSIQE